MGMGKDDGERWVVGAIFHVWRSLARMVYVRCSLESAAARPKLAKAAISHLRSSRFGRISPFASIQHDQKRTREGSGRGHEAEAVGISRSLDESQRNPG